MSRTRRRLLIAVVAILFLAISFALARWLSLENVERSDITTLLQAEMRGDAKAMLAALRGCGARCVADVREDARTLKRPGVPQILADTSPTAYALTSSVGVTRVAWKSTVGQLPVVQCVTVSRRGNVISGLTVTLLRVSLPLRSNTADC